MDGIDRKKTKEKGEIDGGRKRESVRPRCLATSHRHLLILSLCICLIKALKVYTVIHNRG